MRPKRVVAPKAATGLSEPGERGKRLSGSELRKASYTKIMGWDYLCFFFLGFVSNIIILQVQLHNPVL